MGKDELGFLALVDMSPAFDTVDHSIILTRLEINFLFMDGYLSLFGAYIPQDVSPSLSMESHQLASISMTAYHNGQC